MTSSRHIFRFLRGFKLVAVFLIVLLITAGLPTNTSAQRPKWRTKSRTKTEEILRGVEARRHLAAKAAANPSRTAQFQRRLDLLKMQYPVNEDQVVVYRLLIRVTQERVDEVGGVLGWITRWLPATAYADDIRIVEGGGEVIVTPFDDGNADNAEWFQWSEEYTSGTVMYMNVQVGNQSMDPDNSTSVSTWDGEIIAGNTHAGRLDLAAAIYATLTPTLLAQSGTFMGIPCSDKQRINTEISKEAWRNASIATGSALIWCIGATIGYFGCLAASFGGTYVATILYRQAEFKNACKPTSGTGGDCPTLQEDFCAAYPEQCQPCEIGGA